MVVRGDVLLYVGLHEKTEQVPIARDCNQSLIK